MNNKLTKEVVLERAPFMAKAVFAVGLLCTLMMAICVGIQLQKYECRLAGHHAEAASFDLEPQPVSTWDPPLFPDDVCVEGRCHDSGFETVRIGDDILPDDGLPPRRIVLWSKTETFDGRLISQRREVEYVD